MMMDPTPIQKSESLAKIEDASSNLEIAELLINQGRHPGLAEFVNRAPGDNAGAKVRYFLKKFDKVVADEVDRRFSRVQGTQRRPGYYSKDEFLELATEAQDQSIPEKERIDTISKMIIALRNGRVR